MCCEAFMKPRGESFIDIVEKGLLDPAFSQKIMSSDCTGFV